MSGRAVRFGEGHEELPDFVRDRVNDGNISILPPPDGKQMASLCLSRFPARDSVSLDWTHQTVLDRFCIETTESVPLLMSQVLQRWIVKDDLVVVFWGNGLIPPVLIAVPLVIQHLDQIDNLDGEYWIFSDRDEIVIESRADGQVTVGRVPTFSG